MGGGGVNSLMPRVKNIVIKSMFLDAHGSSGSGSIL